MSLLELFKKIKLKKLFQKTTAITLSGLYSIVFLYHPTQSYAQPGILSSGAMPLVSQTLNSNQSSFFMKGVKTFSSEPFKFDFLVENNAVLDHSEKIEKDISKLLKYFMASLAIPNDELWVNLSPDEEDRVISESFSETDMGRDMLTQDYFLKQITSSLTNPEGELGDRFWNNLYARIYDQTGSLDFDLKAFNRVWIVPDQAEVIVTENTAMVGAATFKVLLDRDYQQISQNEMFLDSEMNKAQKIYDDVLKEVIIPVLEDEVNSGKNFIPLRQIFHALILATWFKRSLKQSVFNQAYADKTNVNGIGIEDPLMKEKIYQRYLDAYRQGVYDMIKEEYDPQEQKLVSRQYFSGGVSNLGLNDLQIIPATASSFKLSDFASLIKVETEMASYDPAMVSFTAMKNFIGHLLLVIILATGISFSAQAATYAAGTTGELIVQVEEGDNLSNIAYDIKSTYRSVDSLGYSHSVYQGNMYKSGGAFDQVSANVSEPKGLIQKDQTFVVEGLPQTVVEALVDDDPTENENVIQVDTSSENQNETGKGIESKKDSISITFVEGLNDFTTTSTLSEKTNIQPVEKIETESQTSGAFLNRFSSKQIWAFVLSTLGVLSLVLIGLKHKAKSKKKLLKSTVATQMKKTSPAVEKTETIPAIIIPTVQVDNRSEEIEQIRNEGSSFSFSYQLVPSTDNTDTGFGEKETDSEFGYKIDLNAMRSPVNPVGINEKDNIGFKTHETKLREIKPDQIDFNRTMPVIEDDRVGFGVQERDMETGFQLSLNRRRGDFFQSIADEKNEDRVGFGIQDRDTENAYLLTFDFSAGRTHIISEEILNPKQTYNVGFHISVLPVIDVFLLATSFSIFIFAFQMIFPVSIVLSLGIVFANRILTALQVNAHEKAHLRKGINLGYQELDTVENQNMNLSRQQIKSLFTPFAPFVGNPSIQPNGLNIPRDDSKKITTAGVKFTVLSFLSSFLLTGLAFYLLAPALAFFLAAPVFVSSLVVFGASLQTDVFRQTCDSYGCGNFGMIFIPRVGTNLNEIKNMLMYRSDFDVFDAIDRMVEELVPRGEQEEGIATIINRPSTKTQVGGGKVILGKYVKKKREIKGLLTGKDKTLSKGTIERFKSKLKSEIQEQVRLIPKGDRIKQIQILQDDESGELFLRWNTVMGLMGHVRFSTFSEIIEEAAHPHPYEEIRTIFRKINGKLTSIVEQVAFVITHNGDNDGVKMFNQLIEFVDAKKMFMKLMNRQRITDGDSPLIALELGFLTSQRSWLSSIRYGHTLVMNQNAEDVIQNAHSRQELEILDQFFSGKFNELYQHVGQYYYDQTGQSHEEASEELLNGQDILESYFNPKTIFTSENAKPIADFMADQIKNESSKELADIFQKWRGNLNEEEFNEKLTEMMLLSVEAFFKFDRLRAMKEFQKIAFGAFAVAFKSSLDNDQGVTLLSYGQPLAYGINKDKNMFLYASDHNALNIDLPEGYGRVEKAILMKPTGEGQITDFEFAWDEQKNRFKERILLYSPGLGRKLSQEEIYDQVYDMIEDNPFYEEVRPSPENRRERVIEDHKSLMSDLTKVEYLWEDEDHLSEAQENGTIHNLKTHEALMDKLVPIFIEKMFLKNTSAGLVDKRLRKTIRDSLTRSLNEHRLDQSLNYNIDAVTEIILNHSFFKDFLKSEVRNLVRRNAKNISKKIKKEEIKDFEIFKSFKEIEDKVNEQVEKRLEMISKQMLLLTSDAEQKQLFLNLENPNMDFQFLGDAFLDLFHDINRAYLPSINYGETDLVLLGYGDSHELNLDWAKKLNHFFPELKIKALNANDVLENQAKHGIGKNTIVILNSKSGGQTFATGSTLGAFKSKSDSRSDSEITREVNEWDLMEEVGRRFDMDNVFGLVGRKDSLLSVGLGQKLNKNAEAINRIFYTGNTTKSESKLSPIWVQRTQMKILEHTLVEMRKRFPSKIVRPFGFLLGSNEIGYFRDEMKNVLTELPNVVGYDSEKEKVKSEIFDDTDLKTKTFSQSTSVKKVAEFLTKRIKSPWVLKRVTELYVILIITVGLVGGLTTAYFFPGVWYMQMVGKIFDVTLTLSFYWLINVAYRYFNDLPLWSRLGTQATVFGDHESLSQVYNLFWSKLGSQSLPSMYVEYQSGDIQSNVPAKFAHRIARGGQIISALPSYFGRSATFTSLRQGKNIMNKMITSDRLDSFFNDMLEKANRLEEKNEKTTWRSHYRRSLWKMWNSFLKGGPHVITVGKGEYLSENTNDMHISTGKIPLEIEEIIHKMKIEAPVTNEEIRKLEMYTMINEEFSNFVAIHILGVQTYQPLKRFFDISTTFPGIGVHSTRASKVPTSDKYDNPVRFFERFLKIKPSAKEIIGEVLDEASLVQNNFKTPYGGIDLNTDHWNLTETIQGGKDAAMLDFSFDLNHLASLDFYPVIINIEFIESDQALAMLGFDETDSTTETAEETDDEFKSWDEEFASLEQKLRL